MTRKLFIFTWIFLFTIHVVTSTSKSPHIILIVADDLGWNDVAFHGSVQIPTPNIDALAYAGVILNNYYVQPICTPSRGALLSGMHPIHTGLNHDVIYGPQPYGLPLNLDLLPKYLKSIGYNPHAIGKWHIGMSNKEYTPTYRGFISHYGYWTGHEDYYSHMGLQHHTIGASQPYGLPLTLSLLPEYLGSLGYITRHIGKWHIGHYKREYTPVYRGFMSHYGYWTGRVDYYSRTCYGRVGLQHETIGGPQPYGLSLGFSLLPQYLRSLGYTSRHIGKWHIGCFKERYTPTYRGFDSHFGYWTGRVDYYDHTAYEGPGWWGYDFRRDMEIDREAYGKYTTDLLTNESIHVINEHNASEPLFLFLAHLAVHSGNPYAPLQAPADIIKKFSYIKDVNRRIFAAMLWKLDDGIGKVVKALHDNGMLENSIIVFTTDNGGPAAGFNANAASNWPLRGVKAGMWEGGVRGASFVWSPLIKQRSRVSMDMMQIMDWLPTLYRAAGGNVGDLPRMDGVDVWSSITDGESSPRHQMLHNIEPYLNGAALRVGDWKLLFNPSGYGPHWDGWFGPSGRHLEETYSSSPKVEGNRIKKSNAGKAVQKLMPHVYKHTHKKKKEAEVLCGPVPKNATIACNDIKNPCLFHIPSDPCEYYDISHKNPLKVKLLQSILQRYNNTAIPPANKPWDPKANPVYWSYTWTHWQDYELPFFRASHRDPLPKPELVRDHIWL